MKRRFKRCGHAPGALSPEDQAAVDDFLALLPLLKNPQPWTPGSGEDVAVRVGPFIERGHPRPGDDHGPDVFALALVHPDTPHAPYDRRYNRGWLRCERRLIFGAWHSAYRVLTHIACGLDLPDQPLPPAHYAVHITRSGRPLLRIGPYNQCGQAARDAARMHQQLQDIGEDAASAETAPFDVDVDIADGYHDSLPP